VQVAGKEIAPSLLQSTLYGHERGAFSGAVERQLGLVERAAEGTLFLDELGDLGKRAQGAMLGVMEGRSFRRVGGATDLTPDVRIAIGSQRGVEELVKAGRLREDFAQRLGYEEIRLLPLRERLEDLEALSAHVLARCARELGSAVAEPDREAFALFRAVAWPGNVRQLENVLEYAARRAEYGRIRLVHLPPRFLEAAGAISVARAARKAEGLDAVLRETGGNVAEAARRMEKDPRTLRRWAQRQSIDLKRMRPGGKE
jgi:DNA-binding NtrC family response regulator